jgi:LmbE family N-acetylglucosaminyl deacetylase
MADRLLAGATVLAVFAHPDDESLACGGTLARMANAGARIVLICASRGDRGSNSEPGVLPPGELGGVRAAELRAAADTLGIAELVILNHPDGSLRWADVPAFHGELMIALRRYRPDAVITFGEDGLYWHADHIGVHERTFTAVQSLGEDAPPLYYVTLPAGTMQGIVRAAQAKGAAPPDAGFWGINPDAFGLSAEPPTLTVDVRPWMATKLAALRCHRTQMGPRNPLAWIDEEDARRWLGVEHFHRVPAASDAGLPRRLANGAKAGPLERIGASIAAS